MNTNLNHSIDRAKEEAIKCLEGKSIYEMTVWTREHAQYLKWFCGYNSNKIETILQSFMRISYYMYENFKDDCNAIEDFRAFCVACVLELEMNCR